MLAFGAGICFPAITNASLNGVSGENASLASGVQNAVQQIGGALGIAVFTTIAVSYVHGLTFRSPGYPVKATDGYTSGFAWAAVVMAVGVVVIAFAVEKVVKAPEPEQILAAEGTRSAAPV
jgi:hypothetical protein